MTSNKPSVVCFGEILWDVLPDATMPGGAPMNVAYHLNNLGIKTTLISRVGDDDEGKKLLDLLQTWGLSTEYCQLDTENATSKVLATVGDNHEVTYDIVFPVAWDFIAYNKEITELLKNTDALVFGSLVTRNSVSRNTLYEMVNLAKFKVFDINLRAPHYSPDVINDLLTKTDLLKLNEAELKEVAKWFNPSVNTNDDCVHLFQDKFGIKEIVVTKGSKGASFYTSDSSFDHAAYKVQVADTIGSGDSFLAGFLSKRLQQETSETSLSYAGALAAFVTQQHGACPSYTVADLEKFKSEKERELMNKKTGEE